jgi:hypothetical protein
MFTIIFAKFVEPLAEAHEITFVYYILNRDMGYGTLCRDNLSIGVVSARGSVEIR